MGAEDGPVDDRTEWQRVEDAIRQLPDLLAHLIAVLAQALSVVAVGALNGANLMVPPQHCHLLRRNHYQAEDVRRAFYRPKNSKRSFWKRRIQNTTILDLPLATIDNIAEEEQVGSDQGKALPEAVLQTEQIT